MGKAGIVFAWQNGRGFAGPTGRNPSAQANGLGVRAFPVGGLKGRDSRWRREAGAYFAPSGLTLLRITYPARWAGLRNCRALGASVPQPNPGLGCPRWRGLLCRAPVSAEALGSGLAGLGTQKPAATEASIQPRTCGTRPNSTMAPQAMPSASLAGRLALG